MNQPGMSEAATEAAIRHQYSSWARHALSTLEATSNAGSPIARDWPDVQLQSLDVGFASVLPHGPPTVDVEQATESGWLVSTPATSAVPHAGRLQGLRVAVKDNIDVADMTTRNGTPGGLWRYPRISAPAWSALENAGAVCVGKARTHEMAWGVTTPEARHPLEPQRSVGGSSGGSAACVAANVCTAGLGSDTGGSIRIPAALCGVVGIRPTTGSIDSTGVTPLAFEQDVVGPIAADVATATAMLEVMLDRPLTPIGFQPSKLRVGILRRTGSLDPRVERAYAEGLSVLESAGISLVPCDTLLARQATGVSLLTMLQSSAKTFASTVQANPGSFSGEIRALLTIGESLHQYETSISDARRVLTARTAGLFSDESLDAFITPTTACTAPFRHADTVQVGDKTEPVSAALTRFTAWASVVGMPAVSVPMTHEGLPAGIQVMAPPHQEQLGILLALILERGHLGIRHPD